MNIPSVIAIPIRLIFVVGVISFFAVALVWACLQEAWEFLLHD